MPRHRVESAIPVGTQFSPNVISLPAFLQALVQHSGDRAALQQAVWQPGIRTQAQTKPPTARRRNLPLEAAAQYGLLTRTTWEATPLAKTLDALSLSQLYDEFARHVLLNLGGLRVIDAAEQMRADNLRITADTLADYLTRTGFRVTVHNTAINSLWLWLHMAGVVGKPPRWTVNRAKKEALLGLSDDAIGILAGVKPEVHAYVEALCRMNPTPGEEIKAASVRELAAAILGRSFGQASLPNTVLEPLKRAGIIDYRTRGTSGGKTSVLWTLPAFDRNVLEPFVTRTVETLDQALTAYFMKRPVDIYAELQSADKFVKGQALEAFAIYIMRLLGLRFVDWRKRGTETGGTELDVIMTGQFGPVPTVWQIWCKNTPSGRVRLGDIAKEVGLVPQTSATHIMFLANCPISRDAVRFAREVIQNSPTTIFLLDKAAFDRITADPESLTELLREQAKDITRSRYDALVCGLKAARLSEPVHTDN